MERMVEDLIQSSMSRGEFTNLKGMGQPLKRDDSCPYVDEMEYKINKILINNGFSPPWIQKEADIRGEIRQIRDEMRKEFAYILLNCKGFPGSGEVDTNFDRVSKLQPWQRLIERFNRAISALNKDISDYNLIAPSLNRQLFPLTCSREVEYAQNDLLSGGEDSEWMQWAKRKKRLYTSRSSERGRTGIFDQFLSTFGYR